MIEKILPAQVTSVQSFDDPPDAGLFPAEEAIIHRAVDKRRREFATVRWCARRALAELGVPPAPILPGEGGAPQWPAHIVGSMTHCDGYRAAAVANRAAIRGIGIDAEPNQPLPDDVHGSIALDTELSRDAELRRTSPGVCWDRLLFSAKESVYKTWFPLTHRWLGFEEADITLRTDGTFTARLLTSAPGIPPGFTGQWLAADGVLMTAITLAHT
jgi:4'-phosphopantetheinyl transferase EntD